jgi:hypothetical protein
VIIPPKKPNNRLALDNSRRLDPLGGRIARVLHELHQSALGEIDRLTFASFLFEAAVRDLDAVGEVGC